MGVSDKRAIIASGDGHAGAQTHIYKEYLEKYLHSTFDDYYRVHKWRWSPAREESYLPAFFHDKFIGSEGFDPEIGTAIAWDADLRLKEYDRIGVTCEALYPDDQSTNDPPFGAGLAAGVIEGSKEYPPELIRAGARAYNRWLADFCSADNERLCGLTLLGTLNDPTWCVEEINRAYETGLTTGIVLPLEYYEPLYHHSRYDAIWRTCSELGLSVNAHISKGTPEFVGDDPFVKRFMWLWEASLFTQRPVWCMIIGGVLERFPELRLNVAEVGVGWLNELLGRLDSQPFMVFPMNASQAPLVSYSLKPSEYFGRQCAVVHSTNQLRAEIAGELYGDVPNMVWGGDIGHAEGVWPVEEIALERAGLPAREAIAELVRGIPESRALGYLSEDFFKAFPNIDKSIQQRIANRIGPSMCELGVVREPD